jgi:hypothetical protein
MKALLVRRPDGTCRAVFPDTDGVFPEAVRDLTDSTGDRILMAIDVVTLAEYTEELTRELEEVRVWVMRREAESLADVLRDSVKRYNARKAANAERVADHG